MLKEHPVLQHLLAVGGKHTLRMKLDATDVECLVLQRHNLTFITLSSDFKTVGEVVFRYYPRMIAPDGKLFGDAREQCIVTGEMAGCCHTVKDITQVLEFSAKGLADGLMTETDTKDRLLVGIGLDDVEQETGLRGNARAWREDNLAEWFQLRQFELVVTIYRYLGSQFFDKMTQVIGKGDGVLYVDVLNNLTELL